MKPPMIMLRMSNDPPSNKKKKPSKNTVGMCCPNPDCGRRYLTPKSFYIHTKYYCNQPSRYKCGYCEYHSAVKNYVKAHLMAKHKNLELKIDELFNPFEQKRIYTCPNDNCNRSYSSEQNVKRHLKYECGKPAMFMCFYCDYKYCFKATIKKHCTKHHPGQEFRYVTLKAEPV